MLPERELPVTLHEGRVQVQWWTARDFRWLEHLLERIDALQGRAREFVERSLRDRPDLGESHRRWRAAVRVGLALGEFEVATQLDPKLVRRTLFARSSGAPAREQRARVLAQVAAQLDTTPANLEQALYADLPPHRHFRLAQAVPTPVEFARKLNLATGRSILLRAEDLQIHATQQLETLLRTARWTRLLCSAHEDPAQGCGAVLEISGPLSLFRKTTVYGRAIASWLPVLTRTRAWKLSARCQIAGQHVTWHADHRDPLCSERELTRRFDSKLEERLFRDLRRLAPELEIRRESQIQRAGDRLIIPDFSIVHPQAGLVAVEVIGFWTPVYLERKVAALRKLPSGTRWLLCVDLSLAVSQLELPEHTVLGFRKHIDAQALLDLIAQMT